MLHLCKCLPAFCFAKSIKFIRPNGGERRRERNDKKIQKVSVNALTPSHPSNSNVNVCNFRFGRRIKNKLACDVVVGGVLVEFGR
jgi:hypothetical protein